MDASSLRPKVSDLVFRLYSQPIPLLHDAHAVTRRMEWSDSTLTIRLTNAGHVIAWHNGHTHLTEIIATLDALLPDKPRLSHVFQGERRGRLQLDGVRYEVGLQVERLPVEIFTRVHDDLAAGGHRGFLHHFAPNHRIGLTPLTLVTVETVPLGLAIATFHTFPGELALVKTQSLIECEP